MARAGILDRIISSPINYWCGYVCDGAGAAFFLIYGLTHRSSHPAACVASGLAGLVIWTLLEYLLHRFVFHGPKSAAKRGHARHHQEPFALLGSPLLNLVALLFLLWLLLKLAMPADIASFLIMGVNAGYCYFGILHHVLHHWKGSTRHIARLHHYHEVHHQRPGANYGSTTLLWDRVFGTFDPGKPR